jgi:quinoprotein glucose dehydrogenase
MHWIRLAVCAATLLIACAGSTSCSHTAQPAGKIAVRTDWPTYGQDDGGQRYSTLAQITPKNVAELRPAWTYRMGTRKTQDAAGNELPADHATPAGRVYLSPSEVTPLMADGLLYLSTPFQRIVALRPETGEEVWSTASLGKGQPSFRGVEYWPGDRGIGPRIFYGTREGSLVGLDARTGAPAESFGQSGAVDLTTPSVMRGQANRPYGMTSPPKVWRNLVITGSAVQEMPTRGPAGDVRAWDARTGALVWSFHTVPREGEAGVETWEGDSWKDRSGANVWGFITVDAERGIVYLPIGAPAWDRYGGDRRGDNLFSTTLVALDAATGKRIWHFQVVRHDIWDFDLQAPPMLVDVSRDGRTIPAVVIVSKNGLMFVLDRTTGKPVFEVADRPVPGSNVPSERPSPTQPFPAAPPPLSRLTMTEADIAKVTPELEAYCRKFVTDNKVLLGGPYLPTQLDRPTVNFPGTQGGANWGGGAFDPVLGLVFVNVLNMGQVQGFLANGDPDQPYSNRGLPFGRFWQQETRLMCQQPPWGEMVAVEVSHGEIAWRSVLGVSDTLPSDLQATGRPSMGGPIATAGGLVFIGATDDSRFRAYDSRTGKEVWTWKLEASAHATPITYQGADGRQYVVVVSTGGSFLASPVTSDAVVAFALPKADAK